MNDRAVAAVLTIFAGFCACEEEFSPKAQFQESYVMNCTISRSIGMSDYSPQVFLFHTYDVEATNPNVNNSDPTLSGAKVFLEYDNGQVFELQEDTAIVYWEDTMFVTQRNRYGNPVISYSVSDIPWTYGDMKLKAILPNGEEMWAVSKMPRGLYIQYSYPFVRGITSHIDQWRHGDHWGIFWDTDETHLYFADIYLFYFKVQNDGSQKYNYVKVPEDIVYVDGKQIWVYPDQVENGKINLKFDALDLVMESISQGDPDKDKYGVDKLTLSVTEYDRALSKYYSSINGDMDQYSIRIDKTTYSNVNGGYGIFGSMRTNYRSFNLEEKYIESFGYRTEKL